LIRNIKNWWKKEEEEEEEREPQNNQPLMLQKEKLNWKPKKKGKKKVLPSMNHPPSEDT
jgi:hypothetical protein